MSVQGKSWVMFYPVSSTLVATLRGEFVTRRYYLNLRWFNFFPFVCDGMNDTNTYRTMLENNNLLNKQHSLRWKNTLLDLIVGDDDNISMIDEQYVRIYYYY